MPATRIALAASLTALPAHALLAQDRAQPAEADPQAEANVVTIGEQASEQDPLAGRDRGLAVDADREPAVQQVEGILGVPAQTVQIDPRVLGVAPGEPLPSLRREGEVVRKRDGRLLPTGERGYAVFILEPDPESGDEQPLAMVLSPCMTLESMERLMEDRGEGVRFTLTGQVHTYRGVNYLLPTSQPRPWLVAEEPRAVKQDSETGTDTDPKPADPAGEQAADQEPGDASTETPAEPAAEADVQKDPNNATTPSADEVLEQLLQQRTDAPDPVTPTGDKDPQQLTLDNPSGDRVLTDPLLLGLDPDQPRAELKKEGEFLIARAGRLIRSSDGAHALFVLEADQQGAPEPPLIMQACKLLETMEQTVKEQGDEVPFVITGQVYVYGGANYLLPTIVKRKFDRGNLE